MITTQPVSPTQAPPRAAPRLPTLERGLLRAGLYLALAWFGLVTLAGLIQVHQDPIERLIFTMNTVGLAGCLTGLAISARRYRDE